jgi:hypothetical protein
MPEHLQRLSVIPRTRSPTPLEDRPIESLTFEETKELLRRKEVCSAIEGIVYYTDKYRSPRKRAESRSSRRRRQPTCVSSPPSRDPETKQKMTKRRSKSSRYSRRREWSQPMPLNSTERFDTTHDKNVLTTTLPNQRTSSQTDFGLSGGSSMLSLDTDTFSGAKSTLRSW